MHAKKLAWAWDKDSFLLCYYYISSMMKASQQTLPQWKMKLTPAFPWGYALPGPLASVRENLLLENLSQVC